MGQGAGGAVHPPSGARDVHGPGVCVFCPVSLNASPFRGEEQPAARRGDNHNCARSPWVSGREAGVGDGVHTAERLGGGGRRAKPKGCTVSPDYSLENASSDSSCQI